MQICNPLEFVGSALTSPMCHTEHPRSCRFPTVCVIGTISDLFGYDREHSAQHTVFNEMKPC